jgi:hypothetical protein
MRLAGQRGQRRGHLADGRADIRRRSAGVAAAVGVPGVGAGDGIAEVPLTGKERFTNPAEYLSLTNGR